MSGVIRKHQAPCLGCENRELGCHSKCNKYKQYSDALAKYKEQERAIKKKEGGYVEYET